MGLRRASSKRKAWGTSVDKGEKGTRRKFGAAAALADTSQTILGAPPIEPHVQALDSLPLSMSCAANSIFSGAHLTTCCLLEQCQHCLCGSLSTRTIKMHPMKNLQQIVSFHWPSANTLPRCKCSGFFIGYRLEIPINPQILRLTPKFVQQPIKSSNILHQGRG